MLPLLNVVVRTKGFSPLTVSLCIRNITCGTSRFTEALKHTGGIMKVMNNGKRKFKLLHRVDIILLKKNPNNVHKRVFAYNELQKSAKPH